MKGASPEASFHNQGKDGYPSGSCHREGTLQHAFVMFPGPFPMPPGGAAPFPWSDLRLSGIGAPSFVLGGRSPLGSGGGKPQASPCLPFLAPPKEPAAAAVWPAATGVPEDTFGLPLSPPSHQERSELAIQSHAKSEPSRRAKRRPRRSGRRKSSFWRSRKGATPASVLEVR